ncbi:MAG: hypothetical protein ACMUIM_11765 [bacterium]
MDKKEFYEEWKKKRTDIDVPKDFAAKVMQGIHSYEKQRKTGFFYRLQSDINTVPVRLLRWGLALGAVGLGICRVSYIIMFIFVP